MKQNDSHRGYLAGGLASLLVCIAAAAGLILLPAQHGPIGLLAVLSASAGALCWTRRFSLRFAARTGIPLSQYCGRLYGGSDLK